MRLKTAIKREKPAGSSLIYCFLNSEKILKFALLFRANNQNPVFALDE